MDPTLTNLEAILPLSKPSESLNEERIELLKEINEIRASQPLNGCRNTRLDQLEIRYNSLMDRIENQTPENSLLQDPLGALPPEIWQEILSQARGDVISSDMWEVDQILPFTLVSKSWRQKIISTPTLWTHIQLYNVKEDMEAKVSACIHLSSGLPLNISFRTSMAIWNAFGPTIATQGYRVRSLTLYENYNSSSPADENSSTDSDSSSANTALSNDSSTPTLRAGTFLKMFRDICGKLCALEGLGIYESLERASDLNFILKDAIEMHTVTGVQMSAETLGLHSMRNLRGLTTDLSHYDIVPYIQNFHYLSDIYFHRPLGMAKGAQPSHIDREAWIPTQEPSRCTSLVMEYYPGSLGWSILKTISSSLSCLTISILWASLPDLIITCSCMALLTDLGVTLPICLETECRPISGDNHKSNIKELSLILEMQDYTESRDEEAIMACQRSAERLTDGLITWAPDVEILTILTPDDHTFAAQYIRSLQHLASLTVSGSSRISKSHTVVGLPSVTSISITGRSFLFSAFSYPNISDLSLLDFEELRDWELFSIHEPLHLSPSKWSSLKNLEVANHKASWAGISLPKVEKITVGVGFVDQSFSFLNELASEPEAFPSLHYLGMRSFPEWDILFIMLERRNFLSSSKATPITTLGFPSFPAPMILQPLFDRLRRRLTKRPSNFDISLQSLAEIYFDNNLPGCSFCHMSFLLCTESKNGYFRGLSTPDLQVPTYPRRSNEVIATCGQRAEWWAGLIRRSGKRHFPCNRHDIYDLTEVTGHNWASLLKHIDQVRPIYRLYQDSIFGEQCEGE